MKKTIAVIILMIYLLGTSNVYADNSSVFETKNLLIGLDILDETHFSNVDTVTREEGLIAIMRAIGVTDEDIKKMNGADFFAFVDTAHFSYFGCAWAANIAYGVKCVVDYPTYRSSHTRTNVDYFFFPKQTITVKECLALMIRCLQSEKYDYDLTIEKAMSIGLINEHDVFMQNPDVPISQNDFTTLIGRLLQQKRYKYYGVENGDFRFEGNIDKERSISYHDMLIQRKEK